MQTFIIDSGLRPIVRLVALLNLDYFGIEFAVALAIGSVSLFADSVDFLEDASVNFLIFAAVGWSLKHRAQVGMALAGILLIPALATLWTAWGKFNVPVAPEPGLLTLTGAGACMSILSAPTCSLATGRTSRRRIASFSPTVRAFIRVLSHTASNAWMFVYETAALHQWAGRNPGLARWLWQRLPLSIKFQACSATRTMFGRAD